MAADRAGPESGGAAAAAGPETGRARIEAAFGRASAQGRAALMPYLVGGFPERETSLAVARAYVDAGADLVELGVPYSDPLAEGSVIHAAATRALAGGATFEGVLEIGAAIAAEVPVLVMCYANEALGRGEPRDAESFAAVGARRFAEAIAAAGAAGAIVPDLPVGEDAELAAELGALGLAHIPLVAPSTPPERRARICAGASGFVYVVSLTGVTGERVELPAGLATLVEAVKQEASVPAAVGFGIATPAQVAGVGALADGVIVGSRLVREVAAAKDSRQAAAHVDTFLREARAALGAPG